LRIFLPVQSSLFLKGSYGASPCSNISLFKEIFMKKRFFGRPYGSAALMGVVFLCIALSSFTGCEDVLPGASGENKITSFKIGSASGAIDEVNQAIAIILPADANLSALTPELTVSTNASVSPESGKAVDISYPLSYTVTAENGVTRTYTVKATKEKAAAILESIQIQALPTKTIYEIGESFNHKGLIVVGIYSDDSIREETAYTLDPVPVSTAEAGTKTVTVAVGGKTATFTVSVRGAVLEYIEVTVLKSNYAYGEALDPAGMAVRGYYSDGSDQLEAEGSYTVTGYESEKSGAQTLLVTLNGKTNTFQVYVGPKPEERDIFVTIGLPNTNKEPEIFGIPEGGIKLSTSQNNLPHKIVISSAAGTGYAVYSNVVWYIDGEYHNVSNNIITIYAADYTLKIPHYITFVGIKDGIEYSRTITFTVER
jgi:hypothetical protein